jgi:Fe-S-cluster containining protein
MSNIMKKESYPYAFDTSACASCEGKCCTGESGYIFVTRNEIENISKLLNLSVNDFGVKYLYKKDYKYSIKEVLVEDSYECVFYDKATNGCQIYEARPSQCATFPFWEYYKTRVDELKEECPGIIDV